MRILEITSTPVFYPGGMEKVIWEISKRLAKKHDVTILQTTLYDDEKKYAYNGVKEGVKIITIDTSSFLFGYGYSKKFKNKLNEIWSNFDIVHVHGCGRFTTDFSLWYLGDKLPIVFTSHGFFHTKTKNVLKIFDKILLKKLFKRVSAFTALTQNEFGQYEGYGISKNKIFEVPNGIELKKFRENAVKVKKLKEKYSLGKNVILYVGRIHKSKGLEYLVRAVKNIDCQVFLVGKDFEYMDELKKLAESLGIGEKIIFTGPVSEGELVASYFASDLFALPSEHEGFGIVVIEAMATGLPVVVSDRGSLPYIVENGKNGFVVPFGNVRELGRKLELILKNEKMRKEISKENKLKAMKYDWGDIVNKYENIYKKVLRSSRDEKLDFA